MSSKPKLKVRREKGGNLWIGHTLFHEPDNWETNIYTKREALKHICNTVKYSDERGAMVNFMVNEGYVPCTKKCLYDLIKRTEEKHLPVGDDNWSKRGRPTKNATAKKSMDRINIHGVAYDSTKVLDRDIFHHKISGRRDKVRVDYSDNFSNQLVKYHFDRRVWKGSIIVRDVALVKYDDNLEELFKRSVYTLSDEIKTMYLNFRERCKGIDICKFIGCCNADRKEPIYRIYFNPETYSCPKNEDKEGSSKSFSELRNMIRQKSEQYGSPVVCNGGYNEKRFVCKYTSKMMHQSKISAEVEHSETMCCPFGFTIHWDEYGYFIPLGNRLYSNGCSFHSCEGK